MRSIDKKQLNILIELQEIEIKRQKIQTKLDAVPEKMANLDQELAGFEGALSDAEERLGDLQKTYRGHEADVRDQVEQIKKRKSRLNTLKTNKEYQTTLREIDDLEKKNSRIEDEMLVILDQTEAVETELAEHKENYVCQKAEIEAQKQQIEAEVAEQEGQLKVLHGRVGRRCGKCGCGFAEAFSNGQGQDRHHRHGPCPQRGMSGVQHEYSAAALQ